MTEGLFAIIIAIASYLIYNNVAKQKPADIHIDKANPPKKKTVPVKAKQAQAAARTRQSVKPVNETKRPRKKKTED